MDKKNKGGRPTQYDPKLHPLLAQWMARSGLTNEEMADKMDISPATLYNWQNNHPEFLEALKENKILIDSQVENSLLKRAMGYEYEEIKQIMGPGEDGKSKEVKRVERVKKQVVPDTTAQIFWLKNRQPDKWRDKPEQGGQDASPDPVKVIIKVEDGRVSSDDKTS